MGTREVGRGKTEVLTMGKAPPELQGWGRGRQERAEPRHSSSRGLTTHRRGSLEC